MHIFRVRGLEGHEEEEHALRRWTVFRTMVFGYVVQALFL